MAGMDKTLFGESHDWGISFNPMPPQEHTNGELENLECETTKDYVQGNQRRPNRTDHEGMRNYFK
jgi:hypothetical protein